MKPEDCRKLNKCFKVTMILDKEMLDFQYAECIREICTRCTEVKAKQIPAPGVTLERQGWQE